LVIRWWKMSVSYTNYFIPGTHLMVGGPMPLQGIKYKPSILQPVASLSEMSWLIP